MNGHRNKPSMNSSIKEKLEDIKEWISEHAKIVMPVVLIICVALTVFIAVGANKKAAKEEAQMAGAAEAINELEPIPAAEENPLELNIHPEVNELISSYYDALLAKDEEQVKKLNPYLDESDLIYTMELSKFVESYPKLDVYSKKGPVEGSYMVYVYTQMKFLEYDGLAPGLAPYYICTDESGNLYINYKANYELESEAIMTYVEELSGSEDVEDLYNKVKAEYSEVMAADTQLSAFVPDLMQRIEASTGVILAQAEAEAQPAAEAEQETSEETPSEVMVVKTVKAKEVVNIRSSDSETADKVGKAQAGDEFPLLEEKGNGWSKITFEEKDAYIKTEFLEPASQEVVSNIPAAEEETQPEEETDTQETAQTQQPEEEAPAQTTSSTSADQTSVTVKESVNVRKSANESGEKLGLVYAGEKLELVMKQADGWTKVKYKGQTAYVKSEYVE